MSYNIDFIEYLRLSTSRKKKKIAMRLAVIHPKVQFPLRELVTFSVEMLLKGRGKKDV